MKKILLLIIVLGLVAAGYVWYRQSDEKIAEALYRCDGGKTISAVFYESRMTPPEPAPGEPPQPNGSVVVSLDGGSAMTLRQTISASGARYANENESFVFWNKGDEALIMRNNEMDSAYTNCIAEEMAVWNTEDAEPDNSNEFVNEYTAPDPLRKPVLPSPYAFDKETVQVGDIVAGMEVIAVDDRRVSFSGSAVVSGKISYNDMLGIVFLVNEDSMKLLPQVVGSDGLRELFCPRGKKAEDVLAQYPDTEIRIRIENYVTDLLEGGTCDTATLVEVIGVK